MFVFEKYQGAGNDFIIIDDRSLLFPSQNRDAIKKLCDRRFGIGADGLILIREDAESDYEMVYFNADGNEGSLCGNGGRCFVAYLKNHGLMKNSQIRFMASDGIRHADLLHTDNHASIVKLSMNNVSDIETIGEDCFLDTGSPHYVRFCDHLDDLDILTAGRKIRYNDRFAKEGINVNFVKVLGGQLEIRTYERGVENETLACGTGVTAAVLAAEHQQLINTSPVLVKAKGGELRVHFEKLEGEYVHIYLEGSATFVYQGEYNI